MSELEPRSPGRTPRRAREQRAYRLVLASGALTAVAVVGFVLAIVGVISGTIPVVAAVLAVICVLLLRRTLRP
jgi:ABC-type bacteriocin/lantibiotic exporter with double-glycine peptidase domain